MESTLAAGGSSGKSSPPPKGATQGLTPAPEKEVKKEADRESIYTYSEESEEEQTRVEDREEEPAPEVKRGGPVEDVGKPEETRRKKQLRPQRVSQTSAISAPNLTPATSPRGCRSSPLERPSGLNSDRKGALRDERSRLFTHVPRIEIRHAFQGGKSAHSWKVPHPWTSRTAITCQSRSESVRGNAMQE